MSRNEEWLIARSKLLEKYALNTPSSVDCVHLNLDYPDRGWIDTHVMVNEEETEVINISDVYEPFEDITEWLENMVRHIFDFMPSGVSIDCEGYHTLLYYEPIFYTSDELLISAPSSLCGIFYIYDTYEKKIVTDAFCDTKEFINNIYSDILNFAKRVSENYSFVDDWIVPAYNSEYAEFEDDNDPAIREIFIKKVTSKVIEDFLANENSDKRFIQIK